MLDAIPFPAFYKWCCIPLCLDSFQPTAGSIPRLAPVSFYKTSLSSLSFLCCTPAFFLWQFCKIHILPVVRFQAYTGIHSDIDPNTFFLDISHVSQNVPLQNTETAFPLESVWDSGYRGLLHALPLLHNISIRLCNTTEPSLSAYTAHIQIHESFLNSGHTWSVSAPSTRHLPFVHSWISDNTQNIGIHIPLLFSARVLHILLREHFRLSFGFGR